VSINISFDTRATCPALTNPLWFQNVHHRVHKSLPTGPIMNQKKPKYDLLLGPRNNFFFNLSDQVATGSSKMLFPLFKFHTNHRFLISRHKIVKLEEKAVN